MGTISTHTPMGQMGQMGPKYTVRISGIFDGAERRMTSDLEFILGWFAYRSA